MFRLGCFFLFEKNAHLTSSFFFGGYIYIYIYIFLHIYICIFPGLQKKERKKLKDGGKINEQPVVLRHFFHIVFSNTFLKSFKGIQILFTNDGDELHSFWGLILSLKSKIQEFVVSIVSQNIEVGHLDNKSAVQFLRTPFPQRSLCCPFFQ